MERALSLQPRFSKTLFLSNHVQIYFLTPQKGKHVSLSNSIKVVKMELNNDNMGYHFYADDTQLYLSFNSLSGDDQACSVSQVESCVRDIDRWMSCNKLKLSRDKTELLVISSKYRPAHL